MRVSQPGATIANEETRSVEGEFDRRKVLRKDVSSAVSGLKLPKSEAWTRHCLPEQGD